MSETKKSKVLHSQARSDLGPSSRRYSDEFKRDAVRLVTEEKYTFTAAAKAVGVTVQSLRDWHTKFVPSPPPCDENASNQELQSEVKRLSQQLRRAEMERDILKKATAYFANRGTKHAARTLATPGWNGPPRPHSNLPANCWPSASPGTYFGYVRAISTPPSQAMSQQCTWTQLRAYQTTC